VVTIVGTSQPDFGTGGGVAGTLGVEIGVGVGVGVGVGISVVQTQLFRSTQLGLRQRLEVQINPEGH
jgi:hypothetical protein